MKTILKQKKKIKNIIIFSRKIWKENSRALKKLFLCIKIALFPLELGFL